jgi:hypothetical protein
MVNPDDLNVTPPRDISGARRRRELRSSAAVIDGPETPLDVQESPKTGGAELPDQLQDERPDPAPSATAIAEERAQQLVANISSEMLGELRSLREEIVDLMNEVSQRGDLLREAIRTHTEFAESSMQHKTIIAEAVAKLRAEFEHSRTPLPPIRNI